MTRKFKQIQISNLDERFKKINFEPKPRLGWIKTIRNALSMPLSLSANKLGLSQQSVSQFEKSEIEETITLKSLRKMAEAMDCEFHYAIIPRGGSLKKIIEKRAEEKARVIVSEVNKTMTLEDQKIKDPEASIRLLAKELAEGLSKKLWNEDGN